MRVKFWGVRGSIPTPPSSEQLRAKLIHAISGLEGRALANAAEVEAYVDNLPQMIRTFVGGNTTCIEIRSGDVHIIVDCGSGMRSLGMHLMEQEYGRGEGRAHIFLTHAHWDHLMGFPFFIPAYVPGNHFTFYAVNENAERYLNHQQDAPVYFPLSLDAMASRKDFVHLHPGRAFNVDHVEVTNLPLYHPGTSYAYRFDDRESVFVVATDAEYKSLDRANLQNFIDFYHNADALVFDSQYSLHDAVLSKADWGHSSAIIGLDISQDAGVKRLITFHHDPTDSDEQLYEIAATAARYAELNRITTQLIVGREGLELNLGDL